MAHSGLPWSVWLQSSGAQGTPQVCVTLRVWPTEALFPKTGQLWREGDVPRRLLYLQQGAERGSLLFGQARSRSKRHHPLSSDAIRNRATVRFSFVVWQACVLAIDTFSLNERLRRDVLTACSASFVARGRAPHLPGPSPLPFLVA